jgi:hypothetical protein
LEEADVMKITGHKTTAVFRNYDLGDTEALRDRLAAARAEAEQRARQRAKFRKVKPCLTHPAFGVALELAGCARVRDDVSTRLRSPRP